MGANACDDVFGWADRDPGRAMFAAQAEGRWQPVTAAQLAGRVGAVAAGLRPTMKIISWNVNSIHSRLPRVTAAGPPPARPGVPAGD